MPPEDEVVGISLITKVPQKHNIETYLKRNWRLLHFREMAVLAWRKYRSAFQEKVAAKKDKFYSVRGVAEHHRISYFDVEYNINKPEYLAKIRAAAPDVIVSSNSLIFGSELLNIPKICAINRHSGLLPAFGGLWPVFQAYRSGEEVTGVSVHVMEKSIDTGPVLAQIEVAIGHGENLSALYDKCFKASVDAVLMALNKIRHQDFTPVSQQKPKSYFSFPTE